MKLALSDASDAVWHLVSIAGETQQRNPIGSLPFLIGRDHRLSLQLQSPSVSQLHAELLGPTDRISVRDCGSTNGTFVNGSAIHDPVQVQDGDLIQFANVPFRLQHTPIRHSRTMGSDSCDMALALSQFDSLMVDQTNILPYLQPIVSVSNSEIVGYEVLGRSRLYGLAKPDTMFSAAAQLGREAELSRLLRLVGIRIGSNGNVGPHLFVNTHPKEMNDVCSLIGSLLALRKAHPRQRITIEIHESTVTNSQTMQLVRLALQDMEMGLAYDDFGSGQSRLGDLASVPPDYLKFDMTLIRNIDQAPGKKQEVLKSLVQITKELGTVPLAEGIENEREAVVCNQLGFELFQGYLFGRPEAAASYLTGTEQSCEKQPKTESENF